MMKHTWTLKISNLFNPLTCQYYQSSLRFSLQSTGWSEFYTSIIIKSTLSSIYHPFLEILVPITDWDFGMKAHHHGTQRIKRPNIVDITGRRHPPPPKEKLYKRISCSCCFGVWPYSLSGHTCFKPTFKRCCTCAIPLLHPQATQKS